VKNLTLPSDFPITVEDVFEVARNRTRIHLDKTHPVASFVKECNRQYKKLRFEQTIYGDTTGFGAQVKNIVLPSQDKEKNRNLILNLRIGSGPPLKKEHVRAAMFVRTVMLLRGCSGVRLEIPECITELINSDKEPRTPTYGSIGDSGDLVQSSYYGFEVLKRIELEGREGLALVNGTQFMTGIASLALEDFGYIFQFVCKLFAALIQCLEGTSDAFDGELHSLKLHEGQNVMAEFFRNEFAGNKMTREISKLEILPPEILATMAPLQDYYSIRCLAHALSPIYSSFHNAARTIHDELNSVSDNPVIINGKVKHGGHFDGCEIAEAMERLKEAIRRLGYIARAYKRRATDTKLNYGLLPSYLIANQNGLNNGLQGLSLSFDSLYAAFLKTSLSDTVFAQNDCENDNQDIVSLGMHAALSASTTISQLTTFAAMLAIITRQAVALRKIESKLSPATKVTYEKLADIIPFIAKDRSLHGDLRKLEKLFFNHAF